MLESSQMTPQVRLIILLVIAVLVDRPVSGGGFVKTWGGIGRDDANSVALDGSSNIFVGGRFEGTFDVNPAGPAHAILTSYGGGGDAFRCKFTSDGTFQGAKAWGSNGLDRVSRLAVDAAGNVYAAGEFQNTVDFNPSGPVHSNITACSLGANDAYLCKYDSNGNFLWARQSVF